MKKLTASLILVAAVSVTTALPSAQAQDATTDKVAVQQVNDAREQDNDHAWLTEHPVIVKLHKLINEERVRNGYQPAELDPEMCLKAQEHAKWMAETGYYQHSNLPWPEIIFAGPTSEEAAVNGWIYSPAHHGIMLGGNRAGYGYMMINGRTYWVGVFR